MLAILLCLVAAGAYGTSDFAAGLATRGMATATVTAIVDATILATAGAALLIAPGPGPSAGLLAWGALGGVGATIGALSLYRGFAVAGMSVVTTISAVLAAAVPLLVGVALGDRLALGSVAGIGLALPAIGLVSWQPDGERPGAGRTGMRYGALAGLGFALEFIGLDRAGTAAGAWPLVPAELVALLITLPAAARELHRTRRAPQPGVPVPGRALLLAGGAGVLSAAGNLSFLGAVGCGELSIIAVIVSLYPAGTVLLARAFLAEQWNRLQAGGLVIALAAVVLVAAR